MKIYYKMCELVCVCVLSVKIPILQHESLGVSGLCVCVSVCFVDFMHLYTEMIQ